MKIADVQTFAVCPGIGKNLLYVKLTAEDGTVGWGECYTQSDRLYSAEAHVNELKRYLIGWDSFDVKKLTHMIYEVFASKRGSMDLYAAESGIEHAMWDINGKLLGQPVYNLLGGKVRDRIHVYANGWCRGETDKEIVDRAKATVALGFNALKFDPYPGTWRAFVDEEEEDLGVHRIKVVREAVGPDVEILIENHRRFAPMHAVRLAEKMAPYKPYWFEEPVDAINPDNLAYVNHRTSLPVVTGETLYTKEEFAGIFQRQAADMINPDICICGGILQLREIAAMAEPYNVLVSPHNYNSTTIGLAATMQAAATIPNFMITEYFVNFEEFGKKVSDKPFEVKDGYIYLDDSRPGLGIELDEEALKQYPYKDFPMRGDCLSYLADVFEGNK